MKLGQKVMILILFFVIYALFILEIPQLIKEYDRDKYISFESEFNRLVPFREDFVKLNSFINYFILGKSPSETVIKGKSNWLFYAEKKDGAPLDSYQGKGLLSSKELLQLKRHLVKQQKFLSKRGIEFVLFIVPNKERIYYEYMPYNPPAKDYPAKQIVDYLRANTTIKIIYPYEELMDAKKRYKEGVYYKADTHWNYIGAYIGVKKILNELDITFLNKEITIDKLPSSHESDLARMLQLQTALKDLDTEYGVNKKEFFTPDFRQDRADCDKLEYQKLTSNGVPKTVFVIRDSFTCPMIPYLKKSFQKSYFIHRDKYESWMLKDAKPDILVHQIVERYVNQLKLFSVR